MTTGHHCAEPNDWILINDTPTLIYAGTDDKTWELGLSQWNGDQWTTTPEPWFELGRPGNWDDSSVRDMARNLKVMAIGFGTLGLMVNDGVSDLH